MEINENNKEVQPFLYIITAFLYSVRENLFTGLFISRLLFVLFFAFSVYYFVNANKILHKNNVCRKLNLLVWLVCIYGLIFFISGTDYTWKRQTSAFFFLLNYLESILPIYAFYYFGHKGWIDGGWFKKNAVFFIVFAVCEFFFRGEKARFLSNSEEITNNASYVVLSLFPVFAFYRKNTLLFFTLLLLSFLLVLSGGKRCAILLGCVCIFYTQLMAFKNVKKSKIIFVLIAYIIVFYIAWLFFNDLMENNRHFSRRIREISEGEASNREVMYPLYFSFFLNSNLFHFIFGHCALGTCHYLGLMAHNDWLEMAINMGLLGFFSLLAYWISIYKLWLTKSRRIEREVILAMGLFVIIYFGKTMFSMSIMGMSIVATPVFGYCLSVYDVRNELKS